MTVRACLPVLLFWAADSEVGALVLFFYLTLERARWNGHAPQTVVALGIHHTPLSLEWQHLSQLKLWFWEG